MKKSISYFRSALENLNFAPFVLAGLGALAALWLNNQYVSQEVYVKDQEIIRLKIESLETETQTLRFMALANQTEIRELLPLVEKIETLVSNFITQALNGKSITIYGTGLQTRSFCFVDDLVEGLIKALSDNCHLFNTRTKINGDINLNINVNNANGQRRRGDVEAK